MVRQLVSNGGKNKRDGRINISCESQEMESVPQYRLDLGDNT